LKLINPRLLNAKLIKIYQRENDIVDSFIFVEIN